MSYSLKDIAKDYAANRIEMSENTLASERLAICNACEHKNMLGVCNKCGCLLKAKVKYKKSSCPIGKW